MPRARPASTSNLSGKCSVSESERSSDLKDAPSGFVDARVEALLGREENSGLLDALERASQGVDKGWRELAEVERREFEAQESQRELSEARALVEEAEGSLSQTANAQEEERDGMQINREEQRWEVCTLADLPLPLTQVAVVSRLVLPSAINFVSCLPFKIAFCCAFGRYLDNLRALISRSFLSHAFSDAVYIAKGLLIFVFAAVGLDFLFKMRISSPFPIERPELRTPLDD
ncbi:hypothetical protein ACJRO7_020251 [Eucalyptus globulus]|uniref:Transmembrane protein n=1 Tax=Eucalyptus globulus TaxID=34317 RepID=A0ABD3KM78_EUCGL